VCFGANVFMPKEVRTRELHKATFPHAKTARLSPRRRSSEWCNGLVPRTARGLAVLLNWEVRLVGVAFLGAVVAAAIADRSGGDVVVAAALKATRRRHGSDASGSSVTLGQSGRSNRAHAQDNSSNSRSNTSVHGTIHLGLRGLRRMAAGRDLFSDLDLGPSQPERRAVWHPRISEGLTSFPTCIGPFRSKREPDLAACRAPVREVCRLCENPTAGR
jgi:hypothetical protein